jgi:carboxylate-amine ligase
VTVGEMLERVIEETAVDAEALGCTEEIARCRAIVGDGTSADAQIAVFEEHRGQGNGQGKRRLALQAVTDWIAGATLR